ncbi:MAG: FkbM family methyltransferase, partial [Pseudomonadota bacterium]|nr:FkbM family methyltransferase [Pseudomonadota bacterium]
AKYDRPHANIVKIDTQGSELDILQSFAQEDFKEVVCVLAEVEFVDMYKNQPLFHDIDSYMQANEFTLFDLRTARCYLTKDQDRDHYLKKLGYGTGTNRISGFMMAGDALYFRRFEDNCPKDQKTFVQLLLSYLMFLYFDHAFELLENGLKYNVIDQDQYNQLEEYVGSITPKPRLTERKGPIFDLLRRVLRRLGLYGPYQAFWQERNWPHQ